MFASPDPLFIEKYKDEIKNFNTNSLIGRTVKYQDKHWFFKQINPNELIREQLAYLIGIGIVNISEVKILTAQEIADLVDRKICRDIDPVNNCALLTRIAQDYSIEELPLKNLDSATAGELVFSTLIRRRDAHEYNRSYTSAGVPIFYDNVVAFAIDADTLLADHFFDLVGNGYAGSWRVIKVANSEEIKNLWRKPILNDRHFIYDVDVFKQTVLSLAEKLNVKLNTFETVVNNSGLNGPEVDRIKQVIKTTRASFKEDIELMLEKVFRNP